MHDLIIKNGTVFDGSGNVGKPIDIAIKDGRIAALGTDLGEAKQTLNAKGHIVTPGFIDLHTHYDGQVSWDDVLQPSVNHGVTTAVMGNCGVGFAPCRAEDRNKLIRLMEGVEDIPGTALHEGMDWQWESFPEYLDALDAKPRTIDIAAMVPHDPLRVYAMGDRAVFNSAAETADIDLMSKLVSEAMDAGATSGHGVLQAVNDFDMVRPGETFDTEFALMEAFFRAGKGRPGSMSLMERDFAPDDWKKIIGRTEELNADGLDISFQVAPRAIGAINGLNCTFHPIMGHPSYIAISGKPLSERVEIMRDPDFKAQLLSESPVQLSGDDSPVPPLVDMMIATFPQLAEKVFPMNRHEGSVDYEPSSESSIAGLARAAGVSIWEMAYDLLLEDEGHALFYFPVYNYTHMNYDNVLTMMRHPKALPGLSDGGAHVGTICDASFPTYLLAHWTRDRLSRGKPGITLPRAVQMLTADAADYLGLSDRGRIEVGQKADLNIINYEALSLGVPVMVKDLPAGGQRLLQPVTGYMATYVNGERVIANDQVTDARPGKLVRSKADA